MRHALTALWVGIYSLGLAACGAGFGGNSDAPIPGADELRDVVQARGITTQTLAPSVTPELFDLGQALFFDKLLSGNSDVSCATCHWPELAGGDARTLPRGEGGVGLGNSRTGGQIVPRNSPSVLNTILMDEMFWDGRVRINGGVLETPAGAALTAGMEAVFDSRWKVVAAQAMFPVTSRDEMRGAIGENALADLNDSDLQGIWNGLVDRLMAIPTYQQLFFAAYPDLTNVSQVTFAHAANAIAAFEVSAFTHTDSPWELFVQGNGRAMSASQVAGALEFFGPAGCARCHIGRSFTDQGFHNVGLVQFGPGKGDGAGNDEDYGRERVTGFATDRFRFRTPTLLNVELTAPYGHLGQYATLENIVDHYQNAAEKLQNYDILVHTTDTDLHGTVVANRAAIGAALDSGLTGDQPFDVAAVVEFLRCLTADSARDLSALIPNGVPSGIPLR